MSVLNKIQRRRSWKLREKILILLYAYNDKRTPVYAKLLAVVSVIYLISPIDLIPDFIPVAGWLDDLVIVPLLFDFSFKLLPVNVREDSLYKAARHKKKIRLLLAIALIVILLWVIGIIFIFKNIFS